MPPSRSPHQIRALYGRRIRSTGKGLNGRTGSLLSSAGPWPYAGIEQEKRRDSGLLYKNRLPT